MIRVHVPRVRQGTKSDIVAKVTPVVRRKTARALDRAGKLIVEELQSYTSEMRPPVRAGNPPRPAHPGHWADISGDLRDAYDFGVANNRNGVTLRLMNTMSYAIYLEERDGFFVLRGVFDAGGIGARIMDEELTAEGLKIL